MDNITFYEFIDKTQFSEVINNIITITALNGHQISMVNRRSGTNSISRVWRLFIKDSQNFHCNIKFLYNTKGIIDYYELYSNTMREKCYDPTKFMITLNKLLEEL